MNSKYILALAAAAVGVWGQAPAAAQGRGDDYARAQQFLNEEDRKSTRLNSSH